MNYSERRFVYKPEYKEPVFDFLKTKDQLNITVRNDLDNKIQYIFSKFNKKEDLGENYKLSILEYILIKIVKPVVNDYLIRTTFIDSFYYNFVEMFIEKMVSTVKNYTIESASYESLIPPFETGWINFCSSDSFDDVINEITLICLNKMYKQKVSMNYMYHNNTLTCTLYDVLMKGDILVQKLISAVNPTFKLVNYSEVPFKFVSKYFIQISDKYDNFDYKNYIDEYGKDTIESLKKCVRYIFIELFRQAIPYYIMRRSVNDTNIKFLISDIELYYTKSLTTLRKNQLFYDEKIMECRIASNNYKGADDDLKRIYSRDLNTIIGLIYNHISDPESINTLNNIIKIADENKVYPIESFNSILDILTKEYENLTIKINNSYNFSFIKRWKEIIKDNTIWIPEDYIDTKLTFIKEIN